MWRAADRWSVGVCFVWIRSGSAQFQWALAGAVENGVLSLDGWWSKNLESHPVTLTGALSLPQTQPARAPTTAAKSAAR